MGVTSRARGQLAVGFQEVTEYSPLKVYISYRRRDSAAEAGRLSDRLAGKFGSENVFVDVDSIPVGGSFRETIRAEIEHCEVVIVLIGREWLIDRRLFNSDDPIRVEVETAFQQQVPVVPVLLNGAPLPRPEELPASLREITHRNAAQLRSGPDYHLDCDRLIRGLEELARSGASEIDLGAPGSITAFVSHSTEDRRWVEREIIGSLEKHEIKTWYSKASIKTASRWEREILRGMESCDWFLLVASPRAAASEWVKDELNWAIFNRPTRVAPVIMEHCNLWDFHIRLPRLQHIDFADDIDGARQALIDTLRGAA
jgi:hypothetical protein